MNVQVPGYSSVSISKSSDRNISIQIGSDVSKGAALTLQPGASITVTIGDDSGSLTVANKRDTPVSLDLGHLLDSFGKYQDSLKSKAKEGITNDNDVQKHRIEFAKRFGLDVLDTLSGLPKSMGGLGYGVPEIILNSIYERVMPPKPDQVY